MSESYRETIVRVRNRRAAFRARQAEKKTAPPGLSPEVLQAIAELNQMQSGDPETQDLVKKRIGAETSYWDLVSTIKNTRSLSWLDSIRATERETDPKQLSEKKQKWLDEQNAQHEARVGSQQVEKVDGKTWPEMVQFFKLEHNMSTLQAQREIDKLYPGLRQDYIDKCNK